MLLATVALQALEYNVDKGSGNKVLFISEAPLEDFEGETEKIDGYIYNKKDDFRGSDIYFEVDLNSVDTGIGLRNNHMRENYLYTDKYPFAKYEGKIISAIEKDGGIFVVADGDFEVKGVKHKKRIQAMLYPKGDKLKIDTDFIVNLKEHRIEVPSLMGAKISEDIKLEVEFTMNKVK